MRSYAQIQLQIWNNDEFRQLSTAAQHLYFVLLSLPSLNHAGVGDWRPGRIAKLASDWSRADVEDAAGELIAGMFILVDEETEEYLVRSYVRNDPLMKQPNMATAMARKLAEVGSPELHGVVVHELKRLHSESPELPGWGSKDASDLLRRGSVDPASFPLGKGSIKGYGKGSVNPSGRGYEKGSINPSGNPFGNPYTKGSIKGYEKGCPTPTPTPSTSTPTPERDEKSSPTPAKQTAIRLPEQWRPSAQVLQDMSDQFPDIDLETELAKFHDYWHSIPGAKGKKLDWNAVYRNWIRRTAEQMNVTPFPTRRNDQRKPDGKRMSDWLPADFFDHEPPPDGELPPDEQDFIDAEVINAD